MNEEVMRERAKKCLLRAMIDLDQELYLSAMQLMNEAQVHLLGVVSMLIIKHVPSLREHSPHCSGLHENEEGGRCLDADGRLL